MGGVGKSALSISIGRSGIGKTALTNNVTARISDDFEYFYYACLRDAESFEKFSRKLLDVISSQDATSIDFIKALKSTGSAISEIINYCNRYNCLIVLDNLETILSASDSEVYFKEEHSAYKEFIIEFERSAQQSCLLINSRERPKELNKLNVYQCWLGGINYSAARELFESVHGDFISLNPEKEWKQVVLRCNGQSASERL